MLLLVVACIECCLLYVVLISRVSELQIFILFYFIYFILILLYFLKPKGENIKEGIKHVWSDHGADSVGCVSNVTLCPQVPNISLIL